MKLNKKQLDLLKKHKEDFIQAHGEQAYEFALAGRIPEKVLLAFLENIK